MPNPGLIKTLVHTADGPVRLDRFGDAVIQRAVDAALAGVPEGQTGALLSFDTLQKDGEKPTFNAALAFRLDAGWTIAVAYFKDWNVKNQGAGVRVRKTFGAKAL